MHLLLGRYNRSGYASRWFYVALAAAFGALAIWAGVRGDWLVATIALVACAGTLAVERVAARLRKALAESRRRFEGDLHER
jgi:uncharacterized membrane protein